MTTLVAVLNKHGIAIAADSAVTMPAGNTPKVVNSANKIFMLSKYAPVSIMIYSSASFMGVPWEIIIKEYRRNLKDKKFDKLDGYVSDFISYIHASNYFCGKKTENLFLGIFFDYFYNFIFNTVCERKGIDQEERNEESVSHDEFISELNRFDSSLKGIEKCDEFTSYGFDVFNRECGASCNIFAKERRLLNSDSDRDLFIRSFYGYLVSKFSDVFGRTGLVFTGYGEKEIYPQLTEVIISFGIGSFLKYYRRQSFSIDNLEQKAVIVPFAQVDVTTLILRGRAPDFESVIRGVVEKVFKSFLKNVSSQIKEKSGNKIIPLVVESIDINESIDELGDQIRSQMDKHYSVPLINTVAGLDKEDMANMAKSFVSLTSLMRRMQPGAETVGGPVDVAVISKGDGFVWIDRKQYFQKELNQHFFNNYYR